MASEFFSSDLGLGKEVRSVSYLATPRAGLHAISSGVNDDSFKRMSACATLEFDGTESLSRFAAWSDNAVIVVSRERQE